MECELKKVLYNFYFFSLPGLVLALFLVWTGPAAAFSPDEDFLEDQAALEELQRDAFRYFWDDGDPDSGMAYEADFGWETRPVAVGGTGFGVAAVVVAVDRGWITRHQAVDRLLRITRFLRDKASGPEMHGAFPHWLNGETGLPLQFDQNDDGVDIVETSLLMQGLLIARVYFNGPGGEKELRGLITELWERVDWNWFTNNEENGIYWHWSPQRGFSGLKILGYNECLITYVLAASSPTHPISRKAYNYWTSGKGYRPKTVYGYRIEASLPGAGPLFLAHYSFIGLDPRRLSDQFVPGGYYVRNVSQVLSNRGYCLQNAPAANRYSEDFWGLTASQVKDGGYAASEPANDRGTVAPTAALSSMPYTPHYSMEVLANLQGRLRDKVWGRFGPYDAISLRDGWVSPHVLAIDQLPMVVMVENYRTGLLWSLLMSDPEVKAGLARVGLVEPDLASGFPEMVVTLKRDGRKYIPDVCDLRRHPDSGLYEVFYQSPEAGKTSFALTGPDGGPARLRLEVEAVKGRNKLAFPQFQRRTSDILTLTMKNISGAEYSLPIRLH